MKKRPARDNTLTSIPAEIQQQNGEEPQARLLIVKEHPKAVIKKGPRKPRWILIH